MANPAIHDAYASNGSESASVGTVTLSFTVTTGAGILVVAAIVDVATDVNPVITTNQGDTFTALSGGEVIAAAGNQALAVFYVLNPTVATHTLTNTWDGGGSLSTTGAIIAATFDGLNSPNITDAGTDSGSDSSVSTTVANAVTNDLIIDFFAVNSNPAITVGADQTQRVNASTGTSGGTMYGASTQPGANGGVMSWTWTGAQRTAQVAVRLPGPGGGGGGTTAPQLMLMGVGT